MSININEELIKLTRNKWNILRKLTLISKLINIQIIISRTIILNQ